MSHNPGWSSVPLKADSNIVSLPGCPDCDGRGWFLINPFATFPPPTGGHRNKCQCMTCANAEKHFQATGKLPAELVQRMTPEFQDKYREHIVASGEELQPKE